MVGTADNGMTSSGEQHPAHMRSMLTEIGFSFMALTLRAVVYMPNLGTARLFLLVEVLSYTKCYSSDMCVCVQCRVLYLTTK